MVNPDGRASWFDEPHTPAPRARPAADRQRPRRALDEDGARRPRRRRQHRSHDAQVRPERHATGATADDPRILERVRARRRRRATGLLRGSEGIDNDGDGRINEDGPGGYDMNRNWPSDWQPELRPVRRRRLPVLAIPRRAHRRASSSPTPTSPPCRATTTPAA